MEKEKKAFQAGFNSGYRSAVKDLLSNVHEMPNILLNAQTQTNINNGAVEWIKKQEENKNGKKKES